MAKGDDRPALPAVPANKLGQPMDTIQLTSGQKIKVVPFADFPGQAAKSNVLEYETIDAPGIVIKTSVAEVINILYFEDQVLVKIDQTLKKPTGAQLQDADQLLQDLGHFHDSRRSHPPLAANPWAQLRSRLVDKLHEVRRQRLHSFSQTARDDAAWREALRLAEVWLPLDPSLRDAVGALWISYATVKLKEGAFAKVRDALNHVDDLSLHNSQAEPLRLGLQAQAATLAKKAKGLPIEQARANLEEALLLWPHAPGLRDDLDRLAKTFGVLTVAVPELPDNLSPATAWTYAEKQSLDLLFSRLVQVRLDEPPGQRYERDLVTELPRRDGLRQHVELRRDVFWSNGERLTAADIRGTTQLLASSSGWRDLVDVPRYDDRPFSLDFTLKQGLLDPLAPLRFHVLPQKYRGQPLSRTDDAAFAKAPIGSGPFRYVGRKRDGKRTVAVFDANPFFDLRGKKRGLVREIRMVAFKGVQSDPKQPLPDLVLDVPARSVEVLKKMGYADVHTVANRRVYFLAVNHRVPSLANQDLRRALAHAIARDKILQDHFRGPGEAAKLALPLNGPLPAHCWAWCPPPRVPEDPYQPELAKSFAKKAGRDLSQLHLTLKYPADAPGVKEACAAIADQVAKLFAEVQVTIKLELVPLSSQQLRTALLQRDYELAYHQWDFPDDNYWLWPLFDPHPDALRPGGSNFLGYDNDAKLQSLLRSAMSHRQFAGVRDLQQSIHAHLYERMPLIPLWQLPQTYAVGALLTVPVFDPQHAFAHVLEWQVAREP